MVHVLWDASDLWGPLAIWGLSGLGVPFSLVRASDIAEGILQKENSSLLFVPGGFSRHKFAALGKAGQEAVRSFVSGGGTYMGFCGGAGLALSGDFNLSLCPWKRAGYENRIQHYMSGHLYVKMHPEADNFAREQNWPEKAAIAAREAEQARLCLAQRVLFPIWWPGRFEAQDGGNVTILAEYDSPGPDFWLADLPVAALPASAFSDWEEKYGFSPSPSFLQGEPCVITGEYGKGRYVLAYTHLETPESPAANAYLARLLNELTSKGAANSLVPAWDMQNAVPIWEDDGITALWEAAQAVFDAGLAANLFFTRSPWLVGWRMGLPGAVCNTIRAQIFSIMSNAPSTKALAFWRKKKDELVPEFMAFAKRAQSYLLAERLAMTLAKDLPEALAPEKLAAERAAVFGPPGPAAHTGGILGALLSELDTLAYLQLSNQGYKGRS